MTILSSNRPQPRVQVAAAKIFKDPVKVGKRVGMCPAKLSRRVWGAVCADAAARAQPRRANVKAAIDFGPTEVEKEDNAIDLLLAAAAMDNFEL